MNWLKHIVIGVLLALAAFYIFITKDFVQLAIFGLFAAGSALLPDLDHVGSKARGLLDKTVPLIAAIATYMSYCTGFSCALTESFALRTFALVGVYFTVFTYFKPEHRGITHSFFFTAVFTVLIYLLLGFKFALAGGIGYLSHLLADWEMKII